MCQVEEKRQLIWEQTVCLWLCGTICECRRCSQSSDEDVILCALCRGIRPCAFTSFISLRSSRCFCGPVNPSFVNLKSSSLLGWEWRLSRKVSHLLFGGGSMLGAVVVAGEGEFCHCSRACCLGAPASLTLWPRVILTSACPLVGPGLVLVTRWTCVERWQPAACFALRSSEPLPCALCSPLINRRNSCPEYKQPLNCPGADEQLYLLKPNACPSLFPPLTAQHLCWTF